MEGEGGDAGSSADTSGAPEGAPQDQGAMSTVYNGSVPCVGCGVMLGPVAAIYGGDRHCHHCRKKKHHHHAKNRMSGHSR